MSQLDTNADIHSYNYRLVLINKYLTITVVAAITADV